MQAIQNFNAVAAVNTFVSLFFAFIFGSVIGLERQVRQRTAGLRTNALVAVGAAVFVDLAMRIGGAEGATRVIAYVVSGVGFLGAGSIMKEGANVTGLNTAATLWGSAAVGACAGSSMIFEAAMATIFVLAANTLLRPVVNSINRRPVDEGSGEAFYFVYAICNSSVQGDVRDKVLDLLDAAKYPARSVEKHPFGANDTEIQIVLHATAVDAEELDRVVEEIEALPGVLQAFWNPSTEE